MPIVYTIPVYQVHIHYYANLKNKVKPQMSQYKFLKMYSFPNSSHFGKLIIFTNINIHSLYSTKFNIKQNYSNVKYSW